ncbi:hypothetical protein ACJX0J_039802, partial [Zea mays]
TVNLTIFIAKENIVENTGVNGFLIILINFISLGTLEAMGFKFSADKGVLKVSQGNRVVYASLAQERIDLIIFNESRGMDKIFGYPAYAHLKNALLLAMVLVVIVMLKVLEKQCPVIEDEKEHWILRYLKGTSHFGLLRSISGYIFSLYGSKSTIAQCRKEYIKKNHELHQLVRKNPVQSSPVFMG